MLMLLFCFLEASFKNLISREKSIEPIEGILSSLITRLIRRISAPLKGDGMCGLD